MTTNIYPKYIERAPRRTGKTTRLIRALKDFRGMVYYNAPVIIISPNPHMSQSLKESFLSTLTHFTANREGWVREERVHNNDPSRDILFASIQWLRGRGEVRDAYFFFDELEDIPFRIDQWVLKRTVYVNYTPRGTDTSNLTELIYLNGGLRNVY